MKKILIVSPLWTGMKELYKSAINAFFNKPVLELGIGGFSTYYTGVDQRSYPHDIFLKIGSELGILRSISFLALVGFCFAYLMHLQRNSRNKKYIILPQQFLLLLLFMLLNSCVSGDINDNRAFFVWIGVAYALGNILRSEEISKNLIYLRYYVNK